MGLLLQAYFSTLINQEFAKIILSLVTSNRVLEIIPCLRCEQHFLYSVEESGALLTKVSTKSLRKQEAHIPWASNHFM